MLIKKVLLVEDSVPMQGMIRDTFRYLCGRDVVMLVADTPVEAELIFNGHNSDIDMILLDSRLKHGTTTFELAKKIRPVFDRPIIAISIDEDYRRQMLKCGCTGECPKSDLLAYLREIIGN